MTCAEILTFLPSELKDVKPPPPHKPCSLSSKSNRLFNDRSQPSVASFFKRKAPAQQDKGAQPRSEPAEQQEPQPQPNRQDGQAAAGHQVAEQEQPELQGHQPCASDRQQPDTFTPAAYASAGREDDELARWAVHCHYHGVRCPVHTPQSMILSLCKTGVLVL